MKKKVVKRKFKTTKLFTFLFVFLFVISIFMGLNAFAESNVFDLVEAVISDKSDDVTGNITSINNGDINSDITFHEVGGNVTYNLKIKNTFDDKIKILSISDNNDSDYLIYEYDKHENEEIDADGVLDFIVKVIYQNEVTDIVERNKTHNVDFLISYEKNGKVEEDTLIINPNTSDNITLSIVLFIISSCGLVICFMIDKKKNTKRIVYVLAIFLLVPFTVNAATITYNVSLKTNFQLYDKVVVTYEVNGEEHTYLNKYNSVLDLDDPSLFGYRFDKWLLEDGSDFNTSSVLTEDIKLIAKFTKLEATFTGGELFNQKLKRLAGNSSATSYTVDSNITAIKRTYDKPDLDSMTDDNIVSSSDEPIYAWFDNGTIYYYTEDLDPSLPTGCFDMFSHFSKLESIDLDTFDTSKVKQMTRMFYDSPSIKSLDLSNFDTSSLISMNTMFRDCTNLESVDLSSFDTSKVTDMSHLFDGCSKITSLDLSHFNTSRVTNITDMLRGCSSLETLNISNFDMSKVTMSGSMLPSNLKTVIAKNTKYNNQSIGIYAGRGTIVSLDLSGADTSLVTDMSSMFSNCSGLTTLDLSSLDTSNVTDMTLMFYNCRNLTSLDLSTFNTNNLTSMSRMFYGCNNLESVNLSSFNTSKVTDMSYLFASCKKLSSLDITNFNTSNVTNMSYMFADSGLTSIDLSNFNTSKVTDMSFMFQKCSSLTSLDITNFNTSNVLNMSYMLSSLSLSTIDLSNLKTSNVTNMFMMFAGSKFNTLDVSNFNTSNVTSMGGMFRSLPNITTLDLSNFDTSSVTDISWMFFGDSSLTSVNLSSFNTSNVTNISDMFRECSAIEVIDLSSFDTSSVTSSSEMFYKATKLKTIYAMPSFSLNSNVYSNLMFSYDTKLVGGKGTTYSGGYTDKSYARIDDPDNGKPGYFTDIADKPVNP